ncbi:SPRY domain containing protein [uncultured Caudovirales phage]|uniref:SPRY domain containing protein n=1 Tax=uncultured Caudovirales phage TaxID=2100421 RepID=A0A6J5LBL8_9CAUD|nr:SPRY domain containing protein [uncultured Caudovirales phage]
MTILQHAIAQAAAASGSYQIARSLRFNSPDSAYLNRTPASAGSRTTWTLNFWFKRSKLGSTQILFSAGSTSSDMNCYLSTNDTIVWFNRITTMQGYKETSQVFRDTGAPCNFHFVWDTTNATAADRMRMYINGVRITAFGTTTNPASSELSFWNSNVATNIGSDVGAPSSTNNGYYSDVRFVDGQALEPTSFGAFDANTGVWSPITYTGTYGTNGFWLKLDDNSNTTAATLGKDSSGNSNNWTPNNFSVTAGVGNDSLVDSPTNYGTDTGAGGEVRGNYATLNALSNPYTLTNGNLDVSSTAASSYIPATIALPLSGKYYFEYTCANTSGASRRDAIGIVDLSYAKNVISAITNSGIYLALGGVYTGPSATNVATYGSWTNGDIVSCAVDCATGKVWFYKNGTIQGGDPVAGTGQAFTLSNNGNLAFALDNDSSGAGASLVGSANFGQRPFAYTAPSGFKALCTQNLPTPAIGATSSTLASKNMNVALYTGNGTSSATTQAITGVGFQPDLVWIKNRGSAAYHVLTDAVRGTTAILSSNATDAESAFDAAWRSSYGQLTAFGSDGFTVAAGSVAGGNFNYSGQTYVGWAFKGGNGTVSNTSGSITSTVSANPTAGISVVTYTGTGTAATIGHGLGVAPKMVIIKSRSDASTSWIVYHGSISPSNLLTLQTTGAQQALPLYFNSTATTSTVFSIGSAANTGSDLNVNTKNYVAYCFAEVAGFSKFGSYTGNGSADGPFVYCGFRPKYVMVKRSDSIGSWKMWDAARNTYNATDKPLWADLTNAEGSGANIDLLSNGFKIRNTDTIENASGGTYIFMAFAESPFNYARAR